MPGGTFWVVGVPGWSAAEFVEGLRSVIAHDGRRDPQAQRWQRQLMCSCRPFQVRRLRFGALAALARPGNVGVRPGNG